MSLHVPTRGLFVISLIISVFAAFLPNNAYCQSSEVCRYEPACNALLVELEKSRHELAGLKLKNSSQTATYTEFIRGGDGIGKQNKIKDFAWKEIGLVLFNIDTGQTRLIKIIKEGRNLKNPTPEFVITIENRPSGIWWNDWNTPFKVASDKAFGRWTVILNKYPRYLKNGKREDIIYAPYSTPLHQKELVTEGEAYLKNLISKSILDLKLGNKDHPDLIEKASPKKELSGASGEFNLHDSIWRLALAEQSSPFEFYEFKNERWAYSPFERVSIILALNKGSAYSLTYSPADAAGLMQFTNKTARDRFGRLKLGTWESMRRQNLWARLPNFEVGVRSHAQSIKAAALLQNHNLKILKSALGPDIAEDPNLEHYLAAGYNGGINPVIESIKRSRKSGTNWRQELRKLKNTNETLDYLDKLDYLIKTTR